MKYIKFQELIFHSSRDIEVWKVDFILCLMKNSKKRLRFVFFKNFSNKNYLRYWSKILHSFSKLVYLGLRIFSRKSEEVMREIFRKFVELTWNDPYAGINWATGNWLLIGNYAILAANNHRAFWYENGELNGV